MHLLPGQLTPTLQESVVRLGTWLPFPRVVNELAFCTHVTISEPTARRETETAGAAYVAVQTAEVERLERELPPAPVGPAIQLLSVDGAMVPLVHHEWAEVKTLVLGQVDAPVLEKGERVVHSSDLSYFSRLADAQTFGRLALVETHRRGTDSAAQVCAVTDGAEWEQGFINLHREDAVRILDFSHAAGYLAQAGQAVWGESTEACRDWLGKTLHELKHGSADTVLDTLREMHAEVSTPEAEHSAARQTLDTSLAYLEKRRAQMDYAHFQAAGYPIGSGSVESANKLVVEARLKGAGMHWARPHVDPMLALRNIACSDRWAEAWPQIARQRCHAEQQRRLQRHQRRQTRAVLHSTVSVSVAESVTPVVLSDGPTPSTPPPSAMKPAVRSTPANPWRRFKFGRALYQSSRTPPNAKS